MSAASGFERPSVEPEAFRDVRAAWPTGVVVVTAGLPDGRLAGLVMVSLAPVTDDPPLVLWSVARHSSAIDVWLGAEGYALHVLAGDQEPLAWQFAQRGGDKFADLAVEPGVVGAPLLEGVVAIAECETVGRHEAGRAVILVGRVVAATVTDRLPLLNHGGRMSPFLVPRAPEEDR